MEFSTRMVGDYVLRWVRWIGGTAKVSIVVMSLAMSPTVFAGEAEHYEAALSAVVLPTQDELSRLSDVLVDENPGLRNREEQVRDLIADLYQSDEMKSRAAHLYMQHFSEPELRQLAQLIRDPVVVKYRRIAPTLYLQMAGIERELYERRIQPMFTAQRSDRTGH